MLPEDRPRWDRPRARDKSPNPCSGGLSGSEGNRLRFGERLVDRNGRLFDFGRCRADKLVGSLLDGAGGGPDILCRAPDRRTRLTLRGPDRLTGRSRCLAGRSARLADHTPRFCACFHARDLFPDRGLPADNLDFPANRTTLALRRATSRGLPCLLSCCHGTTPENADADRRRSSRRPVFKLGSCRWTVNAGNGRNGGAEGDRTLDLCIANAALSQLSYRPTKRGGIVMRPCRGSKQDPGAAATPAGTFVYRFEPMRIREATAEDLGFHCRRQCGACERV